jgi:hypothetical protein
MAHVVSLQRLRGDEVKDWPISLLETECNDPPCHLSNRATKKQMVNRLIVAAHITFRILLLISFDQVVFCRYNILLHQPHKTLNFLRDFRLPNSLNGRTCITLC